MNVRRFMVLVVFTVLLAGCAELNYVRDSAERITAADWSKMKTVEVTLGEFSFTPSTFTFERDVPHKLVIRNTGSVKHYFTAATFFRAIATRKAQTTDGEIKAPYFSAIEVFPGRSVDLYFVPVNAGSYGLECTITGHAEQGMTGAIVIR